MYQTLIKPLLFRLSPEVAQSAAHLALKPHRVWQAASPLLRVDDSRLAVNLAGMSLPNPIGLAAGYDKDCEYLPALSSLGFGYLTCGTVTETPRVGNPLPRVVRYEAHEAIVNSLGFPGKGVDYAAARLKQAQDFLVDTYVVVSVSGATSDEILRCHRRLEPLVSAVEVNISSPNMAGMSVFQQADTLRHLLERLNDSRRNPLFVKMPTYLRLPPSIKEHRKDMVLSLVDVCLEQGVDAVTVANTQPVGDNHLSVGAGGLSGKPVFADMLNMVTDIKSEVGNRMAINACGGVFSGEDAVTAIQAGATTVQILTSLIYKGPGIAKRINQRLLTLMDEEVTVGIGLEHFRKERLAKGRRLGRQERDEEWEAWIADCPQIRKLIDEGIVSVPPMLNGKDVD